LSPPKHFTTLNIPLKVYSSSCIARIKNQRCGIEFCQGLVSVEVVAHACHQGFSRHLGHHGYSEHGLPPQPLHLFRWLIGSYIDGHHRARLTDYNYPPTSDGYSIVIEAGAPQL